MKSALKISAVFLAAFFVLGGCSNIPDEPVTSTVIECSYIDPVSETYPVPDNIDEIPNYSQPVRYVEGPVNIECVFNSYYVDGNSVARVKSVTFSREPGEALVSGTLAVKIEGIGSRGRGMKIAYTCYDADGNAISEDLSTRADLKDAEENDTLLMPLTVMNGTAKIVFTNYAE